MNPNFATKNKFKAQINFTDMRTFEFFIRMPQIGGINMGTYMHPTPIKMIEYPGDSINIDDVVIDFYIDEEWESWIEIFNWIKSIKSTATSFQDPLLKGDITIEILNSKFRPVFNMVLVDVWPYSLTAIALEVDDDTSPMMGQAIFKCDDIKVLPKN